MTGSLLLSHTVSGIVPSAAGGLTIVFGMGTGVSHRRITTSQIHSFQMPFGNSTVKHIIYFVLFLRKEVIQPHLPIRLPCYDFTPVIIPAFDSSLHFWLGHWLRALTTPMV